MRYFTPSQSVTPIQQQNYDTAMKLLKSRGVKFGDNTLTLPKTPGVLGIRLLGFVDYLKSTGVSVAREK